jgi:hypothetical protein
MRGYGSGRGFSYPNSYPKASIACAGTNLTPTDPTAAPGRGLPSGHRDAGELAIRDEPK